MSDSVVFGIDLGTTNCSISCVSSSEEENTPSTVLIPQLSKSKLLIEDKQMPSALYIPIEGEFKVDENLLPWNEDGNNVVGALAKDRASDNPDRVVLSAKSWLCQSKSDAKKPILPWGSEIEDSKLSPFTATVTYLKHLKSTIENYKTSNGRTDQIEFVLTVPASFDEMAKNLTLEAASVAGLEKVSLLEEPLAAFYSWVSQMGENWRDHISIGNIVLVCDIGGGTADFSLIYVGEEEGKLNLQRLSVGKHLLLGGDNMDLALAFGLRQKLEESGKDLDNRQFQSLIHQSRLVKEKLFVEDVESLPVSIAGRGSSLFASTMKVDAKKSEVISQILDGFFPKISLDEAVIENTEAGISELGLPFENEPALTKHLGDFFKRSSRQIAHLPQLPDEVKIKAEQTTILPDFILFNGGVCTPSVVRERILEVVGAWGNQDLKVLEGTSLVSAVAQGASYFGKVKLTGQGIRIKAGIPRSYYLGLKSSMPAVPGYKHPTKGLCVVPRGMEEGTSTDLSKQIFSLITGQEVVFQLFTSNERGEDDFGFVVDNAERQLEPSSQLKLSLPVVGSESGAGDAKSVPVRLYSQITDLGTLELWMQSTESDDRWKLEFDVRTEKKTLNS